MIATIKLQNNRSIQSSQVVSAAESVVVYPCYYLARYLCNNDEKALKKFMSLTLYNDQLYKVIETHLSDFILSKRHENLNTLTGRHRHQTRIDNAFVYNLRKSALLYFFHACACLLESSSCLIHKAEFEILRSMIIEKFGKVKKPEKERKKYVKQSCSETITRFWIHVTTKKVLKRKIAKKELKKNGKEVRVPWLN